MTQLIVLFWTFKGPTRGKAISLFLFSLLPHLKIKALEGRFPYPFYIVPHSFIHFFCRTCCRAYWYPPKLASLKEEVKTTYLDCIFCVPKGTLFLPVPTKIVQRGTFGVWKDELASEGFILVGTGSTFLYGFATSLGGPAKKIADFLFRRGKAWELGSRCRYSALTLVLTPLDCESRGCKATLPFAPLK